MLWDCWVAHKGGLDEIVFSDNYECGEEVTQKNVAVRAVTGVLAFDFRYIFLCIGRN